MDAQEERWAAMHRTTAENIARHGRSLIGVVGDTPFSYTIGHYARELPELLVIGTARAGFLNALGDMQAERGEPLLGDVSIGGQFPLRLVAVRDEARVKDEFTCQVFNFYRTEGYKVTQVLIPDKHGRFPGEAGCEEPFASFEVL
jgi:hypothetical protein